MGWGALAAAAVSAYGSYRSADQANKNAQRNSGPVTTANNPWYPSE